MAAWNWFGEIFSEEERERLRPYFSNLDGPVFALVNLPEVVKGALFARYSRSAKSLKRLFLDEFLGDVESTSSLGGSHARAEELYERMFMEYGDDSVAQLGGVHLACEQASNHMTKVLEWGRLMSYLEQSTRYVRYDDRLQGRYRYVRDPAILDSALGALYISEMDALFEIYTELLEDLIAHVKVAFPKDPMDSDFVYRQAVRAKALDAARAVLPAGTVSNLGMFGTGQAYENLLLRLRANPLTEAQVFADLILRELRKVIPSFVKRVDLDDRGVLWSDYLASCSSAMQELAVGIFGPPEHMASGDSLPVASGFDGPTVSLSDWYPRNERDLAPALLGPFSPLSAEALKRLCSKMSEAEIDAIFDAYVGSRENRRHRPGRGLEHAWYNFEIVSDYGAFRDLQRHRMLTVQWQSLSCEHGYDTPTLISDAGLEGRFVEGMERSASLYDALSDRFADKAVYAVSMAYRIRYFMAMNAREAMHLIELRSQPSGHVNYRSVAQQMHLQIDQHAGHRRIAAAMKYLSSDDVDLERLEAERRTAAKREAIEA